MYDAALLTRCYTLHALRPYMYFDSEVNQIKYLIKIPFINKGIEFIYLPIIFRDNTVISSVPSDFENIEPPMICCKYKALIHNAIIFNFYNKFLILILKLVLLILESVRILNFVSNQLLMLSLEF